MNTCQLFRQEKGDTMWPFKNVHKRQEFKMITDNGNGFYVWNGKLFQSDIVRACIKPKTKAIGKLIAKHVRDYEDDKGERHIDVNKQPYMKFLLAEPNQFMTGQMLQEKVANQLALNGNAFILILRDDFGVPCGLFPIPCTNVQCKYIDEKLYLNFYFQNGKNVTFPYTEIIHLKDDYFDNDVFGESPLQALSELMTVVGTIDNGIVNAIKNSGVIKWLLEFTTSLRPEDLKKQASDFADNYLSMTSESLGVAATDSKSKATQIQPHDYVPNAAQSDRTVKRIYAFFNTNEKIVNSTYSEDEWVSYYEQCIEPLALQMSNEYTRRLFTRNQISFGNQILFESSNLTFASMGTKLQLVQFVDRGVMTPNEVRYVLGYAPIEGGDVALLRKDTGKLSDGKESDNNGTSKNKRNNSIKRR